MTTHQLHQLKEINMKKIVVAALTLVGLAAVVTFVAKQIND